jgi:prolyl oligopeptidase
MKNIILILIALSLIFNACKGKKEEERVPFDLDYPETLRQDVEDDYFGTIVKDPYRWLEDDMSAETKEWVISQNELTFGYLETIPFRTKIQDRLTQIWDYPKISAPVKKGDRYFYYKNDGLQNQSVLYYKNTLDGHEIELLDPNKLAEDGSIALASTAVSDDGKYLTYLVSKSGSDWREAYVRDIETGEDLEDHIKWIKFSGVAWYEDGFFYARYPEPDKGSELTGENMNSKVYYHKLGDTQDKDILIYEDTDNPQYGFSVGTTENQELLIISVSKTTSGNALYYKDLTKPHSMVTKLINDFDNDFYVMDYEDNKLVLYTNYEAPKYRLIEVDLNKPDRKNWKDIISEDESVLRSANFFKDKIIANYMEDAKSVIKIFERNGEFLYNLDVSIIGTISGFSGEKEDNFTFFTVTSFTTPATIYKYDIANNKSTVYQKSEIDFDTDEYITKQIFYKSKDGTEIPMFIVHKKGIALDGNNPTLLYGYGGFNISLTPHFSVSRLVWLEQGGVYAVANIRGGGEYGEKWHKAGTLMQKQNVFDDFIAAAEYLVDEEYTSPKRLAIQGGSNGGLLVGAVINQRPDLFAVALPAVGVMDMLRYHLFTIGRYWAVDYGMSEDSEEMFNYLYAYSPLHNIKEGVDYPAVLVTTGDHDDRVVPAHSFKYISELQYKHTGETPVMVRIETEAGHGAGKPTYKAIEEISDILSFTFYNMYFTPIYEE